MKHLRQTFLLCLLWMIGMVTHAEEIPNNEIWYTASWKLSEITDQDGFGLHTNAFNATITSHEFSNGNGVITFDANVTSIGESAFSVCDGLTSITIPNTVTSIGKYAFSNCSSLISIVIPNSVTNIGEWAFNRCSSLTSITIPSSVTSIGEHTFYICSGLTNIEIPNSVTSIGEWAFGGCSSLTSITIPNSVTSIGDGIFYECTSLTSIEIPNAVTGIGGYTFQDCSSLTSITIPKTVTSIGWGAFVGCSGLTSITVESGNTVYDSRDNSNAIIEKANNTLIAGCKNTIIPNSVTSIGDGAFFGCSDLASIIIPQSVTSIEAWAFKDCSSLTSIEIPNSVTSIRSNEFEGCSSLTSIIVESGNTKYDSRNDCNAIIETATNTLISGCKNTVIPNSVTSIGEHAFYFCSSLTSITIPDFVTSIGYGAFAGCSGLTSIAIPNSVTSIEGTAFYGCSNLTSIDIPNTVTSIGWGTFESCSSLTNIEIPNTVKSIGSYAFANCSGFTSIAIPNSVTSIEDYAFLGCSNLTSIDIPNTVKSIGSYAFDNCSGLTSITIPNSVTSIGEKAFEWCFYLTNVYVNWDEPLDLSSNPFDNYRLPDCTLYVPAGTKALYEQANVWKDFGKIVECLEPTTDITLMWNVLYIKDVEARQGTELTIPLNLKNTEENITAFECKVYLPAGVEWAYTIDKRGNKVLTQPTFNEDRTDANYHTINSIKQMDDGSYYVIVYSDSKETILENDGAILFLPVAVSNEMEAGEYNILVKDIVIVNKNTEQVLIEKTVSRLTVPSYILGDANDDKMINITDVVAVISYMLQESPSPFVFKAADVNEDDIINVTDIVGIIDIMTSGTSAAKPRMARMKARKAAKTGNSLEIVPFTVAEGTTTKTVALELNNPGDEFTAFECKVYLPAGVEWAYTIDRRGNKIYTQPTFNEDRTDANYHTINSIKKMDDGGYYVIVYSDKKEIFLEEEGALLYLPLVFSEDMTPGVYDIRVGGIVLTRPDVTQELLDDYTASVMVGSPDIASLTLFGDFTADAIGEYNTALASNVKVAAMDFSNATDVDATTSIATGNRNLLVYVAEDMSIANTANVVVGDVCESLVLTDGYPFCAPRAFTATEASYTRTLNGNCATICLPFAPTAGNATFFCLSSVDGNVLNFTSTGAPLANTPYLIKADGGTATATAVNAEINTSAAGTATSAGWTLNGTFSEKSFTSGDDVYALSSGKLYHNTGTLTIAPFRAYFTFSGSGVKEMSVSLNGEATGITLESSADGEAGNRFNLSGQAVGRDYKGIVIINGRKEFRK